MNHNTSTNLIFHAAIFCGNPFHPTYSFLFKILEIRAINIMAQEKSQRTATNIGKTTQQVILIVQISQFGLVMASLHHSPAIIH